MLTDGRIPSGAYAHSWGHPAARNQGMNSSDVPGFIEARAASVGYCEAAFSAFAVRTSGEVEWEALESQLAARLPVPSTRKAMGTVGAGLLETGLAMLPGNKRLVRYSENGGLDAQARCRRIAGRCVGNGSDRRSPGDHLRRRTFRCGCGDQVAAFRHKGCPWICRAACSDP